MPVAASLMATHVYLCCSWLFSLQLGEADLRMNCLLNELTKLSLLLFGLLNLPNNFSDLPRTNTHLVRLIFAVSTGLRWPIPIQPKGSGSPHDIDIEIFNIDSPKWFGALDKCNSYSILVSELGWMLATFKVCLQKIDAKFNRLLRPCFVMFAIYKLQSLLSWVQFVELLTMLVMHQPILLRSQK